MSVTPAFLDELRARVPISDLIGRFVTWDQKKSQPAKGDYWAPCPFHSEKTASFHADDRKGFYYCFGCHEKGDAINFLKTKANMEFMDAVRELASMAGMPMPEYSPQAREKADSNARLVDMHEKAAQFFALNLASAAGTQAREYLSAQRQLSAKTVSEFGVGFIQNARDALTIHLREKGFTDEELVTGGLSLTPDDGGAIFDRFRNRIMFPIKDGRGRVVAFGGRAMDPAARAKYLNSAESPIFHKGRQLYNLHQARNHVKDDKHLIIAEGYMDVVAIAQAGFEHSIAPMGTAITDEQLDLVWRIDQMPVVALDGDQAGQRAALRLCDLALPKIGPGKSLRFAIMPAGLDPDDLIKEKGAAGFAELIASAKPMVEMLWKQALGDTPLDTPEARSDFDKRLRVILGKIPDANLREHYKSDFSNRRRDLWKPAPSVTYSSAGKGAFKKKSVTTNSKLTALLSKQGYENDLKTALVLKTVLSHPSIAGDFIDEISALKCLDPQLDALRREIVIGYGDVQIIENIALTPKVDCLKQFSTLDALSMTKAKTPDRDAANALRAELMRQAQNQSLENEIEQIMGEIRINGASEALNNRLSEAISLREKQKKDGQANQIESDDSASFLRQFLESESWRK